MRGVLVSTDAELYDELAHFGKLGMKWGHRQGEVVAPGGLSKKEKKDVVVNGHRMRKESTKAWADRNTAIVKNKGMADAKYNALTKNDETLKKGMEIVRISRNKNEMQSSRMFASYKKDDIDRYIAEMGLFNPQTKTYLPTYKVTYKLTKDLKSPSQKARLDAFSDLFDSKSLVMADGKKITGREYLQTFGMTKEVAALSKAKLGKKLYDDFTNGQLNNTPISAAYFKSVKAKGYNYVVDDLDRNFISKSPIILLSASSTVKQMNIHKLTDQEIYQAQKAWQPGPPP